MSDDYDDNSRDWCDIHSVARTKCKCTYFYGSTHSAWTEIALSRQQLAELPSPAPLITNTLDLRTLAMLAGPWGCGKTFIALDWALSVVAQRPWQGRDIPTFDKGVLYVAAEGVYGIRQRVDAWQAAWQIPDSQLHGIDFVPLPLKLGTRQVHDFSNYVADYGYGFVIIDTLARCTVGFDENSAKDAGQIIDSLERIKDATDGGTVLVIHHTGKDGRTIRGSSAFEGAMETVYLADGDSQHMRLRRTKRKDGPTPDTLALRLEPVPGTDSVVVSGGKVDTTRTVERIMSTFVHAFSESGASKADLRSAVDMSSGSFHRGVNRALQDGLLVNVGTDQRPFYRLSGESK